jgi:uncharacterized protein (DUF1778 family)
MVLTMPKLKKPSEKGTEFVATRLTAEEKREVDALAEAEGLTLSDFFRKAIAEHVAKVRAHVAAKGKRR